MSYVVIASWGELGVNELRWCDVFDEFGGVDVNELVKQNKPA